MTSEWWALYMFGWAALAAWWRRNDSRGSEAAWAPSEEDRAIKDFLWSLPFGMRRELALAHAAHWPQVETCEECGLMRHPLIGGRCAKCRAEAVAE